MASSCCMSVADMLDASVMVEVRGRMEAGHELDALPEHAKVESGLVAVKHLDAALPFQPAN